MTPKSPCKGNETLERTGIHLPSNGWDTKENGGKFGEIPSKEEEIEGEGRDSILKLHLLLKLKQQ